MPAFGYPLRRHLAVMLGVMVCHVLALGWIQHHLALAVPREPPQDAPAPDRVVARLLPPAALPPAPLAAATAQVRSRPAAPADSANANANARTASAVPLRDAARVPQTVPESESASTALAPVPQGPALVRDLLQAQSPPAAPGTSVEQPSSSADFLHNPEPQYPRLSRVRGEQGRVVVNVLIGVDGSAQQTELLTSSGFHRLDQAALATVRGWRYVPGKRAGVPEAMWFSVPIQFVIR